jgi:hypothetical protein
VTLSAQAEDGKAAVEVGSAQLLPGAGTDIPVTVTAENGTVKVYTVTAVRAPEHGKTEEYLSGVRQPVPEETVPETTLPEETTEAVSTEPTAVTESEQNATEPTAADTRDQEASGFGMVAILVTGLIAAVAGAAITVLIFSWKKIF